MFIVGFFPGTLGVHCTTNTLPRGNLFMTIFQFIWTSFVIYQFRHDELFKKGGFKKMYDHSKRLALDDG